MMILLVFAFESNCNIFFGLRGFLFDCYRFSLNWRVWWWWYCLISDSLLCYVFLDLQLRWINFWVWNKKGKLCLFFCLNFALFHLFFISAAPLCRGTYDEDLMRKKNIISWIACMWKKSIIFGIAFWDCLSHVPLLFLSFFFIFIFIFLIQQFNMWHLYIFLNG